MSLLQVLRQWLDTRSRSSRRDSRRSIAAAVQQLERRALLSGASSQFIDPHPQAGNQFGTTVTVLTNGNVVITSPNDTAGGGNSASNTGAGAVYLFNGQTGALISTVNGSHAGDQLGSGGITALPNASFVIESPNWNVGRGAVTWASGTSGVTGIVSSVNSLVGSTIHDQVGQGGVTVLSNGNYVVDSYLWNNGAATNAGAVTWSSAASGFTGFINSSNSLVGSHAGDQIGSGVLQVSAYFNNGRVFGVSALTNGNYVVDSPNWNNSVVIDVGAVTWANGMSGITGVVSSSNSLVGSTANDNVGGSTGNSGLGGITVLTNGNYVVDSPDWSNGAVTSVGAVTWVNGSTGLTGFVRSTNSLVGTSAFDLVGGEVQMGFFAGYDGFVGVTPLPNGNYVVCSPNWSTSDTPNVGAVTLGEGVKGSTGHVSPINSLVGSTYHDNVGSGNVTVLTNGNYVVKSNRWFADTGAATWCSAVTGTTGAVSAANSLVGSNPSDDVGLRVAVLANGNYVVDSYLWNNLAGAVTWGSGISGVSGVVSSSNSLVGQPGQLVGNFGVTPLTNGNYVVDSPEWNNGSHPHAGAVTWSSGTKGITGFVGPLNSLIGTSDNDNVGGEGFFQYGGVTALNNGNYIVASPGWNNGAAMIAGAVTWCNGSTGLIGQVSPTNSLVGSALDDGVGGGRVTALTNGNYVVDSFAWDNGNDVDAGAVTLCDGLTGMTGAVSIANSLVGPSGGDELGWAGIVGINNGNYVVLSSLFGGFRGAATFGSGVTPINAANTVVGPVSSGSAATIQVTTDESHGALYAAFPNDGSGHVYRGLAATGFLPLTNSGPSIGVSSVNTGLSNGTGSLIFGTATFGSPVTQTITVTNYGNAPLVVQPVIAPSGFTVLNNFTTNESISSGASVSFALQLTASTPGLVSGTITIPNNDPANKQLKFLATGTVQVAQFVLQQGTTPISNGTGTVNLGSTGVGNAATQRLTIRNTGNAALSLTSISLPAAYSVVGGIDFTAGQLLAPGASASLILQLDATSPGTFSGIVSIGNNDPANNPFVFNVTGTVTAANILVQQGVNILPGSNPVSFGNTPVGNPVTQVISVLNTGNGPLIVQPVTVPSGFSVVNNFTVNQSIPQGATATFTLRLNAAAAGAVSGNVTILSNDPGASVLSFPVAGVVASNAPAPLLVVSQGPTPLSSGSGNLIFDVTTSQMAVTQVLTVSNQGTAPLIVQPVTVPMGFSVLNNFTNNQSIAPGTSVNLTLQLNSAATGTPMGTATIKSNSPTSSSFTLNVVANHAPTAIALNPNVAGTNLSNAVVVGILTTTDPDSSTLSQTFADTIDSPTFTSGTSVVPVFSVDSQGQLLLATAAPVGVYYSLPVTSSDQGGLSCTQQLTVYITGASTVGIGASVSIVAGALSGTTVATVPTPTVTLQNAQGKFSSSSANAERFATAAATFEPASKTSTFNVFSYHLGSGGDNQYFTIDASGQLKNSVPLSPTVKTTYHVTVISTNTFTGESTSYPYTVTVLPIQKSEIHVASSSFALTEGSSKGTLVGTVSATGVGATVTYTITGGNTSQAFAINRTTGQISVANSAALDLTTNPTFVLTVKASDNGTSNSAKITIHLTGITLSNSSIAENAAIGSVIGQFNTVAAATGNTFHYVLAPGKVNNTYFTIDASGHLKLNAVLNAAVKSSYVIDVLSTDQHGVTVEKRFTITVLGPSNLTLSNSSVARTAAIGTIVGQFNTTDAGTGNTFRYSLVPGTANDAAFTIDADGNLKLNLHLTSTLRKSLTVNVISTDQRGLTISKLFTIAIYGPRVV